MNNFVTHDHATGSEIAIIGMAGRFPKAKNIDEFWKNLHDGVEAISFFTDEELESSGVDSAVLNHPNYVKASGVLLEDIGLFDAPFFGFSPREAEIMDPQHRLFLECTWEALESAGYNSETYEGSIGIYAGVSPNTYLMNNLLSNPTLIELVGQLQLRISNDKDFLTTLVSYKLGLRGPSVVVQTACSTSLIATCLACQGLLNYQCDIALTGGVSVKVPHKTGYLYHKGGILSPDGHCRAFDAEAGGSVDGNGAGVVVLKRLADALVDGDHIYAVIKGSAINNDGSLKVSYTAPGVDGQAEVIAMAQAVAGVEADTISYIETHGTGTLLGDPIEIAALTQAFRTSTEAKGFCAIGAVKTNIGHLDAAAGVAGLIKTVLALKHKLLPPSLHFKQPNPQINFLNSPFYLNTKLSEWKSNKSPRRAGVSSFGVGGTNGHVVLEEAPIVEITGLSRPSHLLLLSAKTNSALETATDNLVNYLKQHPEANLADIAYTLQVGRRAFSHRRLLVCHDLSDAIAALERRSPQRVLTNTQQTNPRSIAFMFAGLGDHYVNIGLELYQTEARFREQIDLCAELLKPHLGLDIRDVLYPDGTTTKVNRKQNPPAAKPDRGLDLRKMLNRVQEPADEATQKLSQTYLAQPALFAIEYALAKLLMAWGIKPQALVGHSLGEYVVACLSGVFSLEDALFLVAKRARIIQDLPSGAMLSVLLPENEVQHLLGQELSLSAINGPSLCVVAGPTDAISELEHQLTEKGVASRRLQTSHAFHSKMMKPILETFTKLVKTINLNPPQIPYVSNVTGTWITAAQAMDPTYWSRHLHQAVRFADGVRELGKESGQILLEVGPGQSLSSLAMQQPKSNSGEERIVLPILRSSYDQQTDVAFLLNTLGKLWLAGLQIDWSKLYTEEHRQRIPLPTYPFERQRYWIEPQKQIYQASINQDTSLESLQDLELSKKVNLSSFHTRPNVQNVYVAPSNELERTIVDIWHKLLGIEQVGIYDNFFELGGHSLLAPQLLSQLESAFQVKLSLSILFEAPTVAGLAQIIDLVHREGTAVTFAGITPVALNAEVVLDSTINPTGIPVEDVTEPASIFLTGATGFLGAFLLHELLQQTQADVYCLVRDPNTQEGKKRIQRNLKSYLLKNEGLTDRIIPVVGDFTQPLWGLSEQQFQMMASKIDAIYHCGAWVNFTYPYSALKSANVLGLQEALRLASQIKVKPVHFISSIAVFSASAYSQAQIIREDNNLDHIEGLFSGYAETKWVAEKIIAIARARGIPVSIYRPGVIGGHSQTGIGNTKDLIWNLIKGFIQLGIVPDIDRVPEFDAMVDIAPVDYVSRAVVHISRQKEWSGKVFHLLNPQPMHWSKVASFIRAFGYPLRQVSNEEWQEALLNKVRRSPENALYPFMPLLSETISEAEKTFEERTPDPMTDLQFDCQNTLNSLANTSISCPPVDPKLLGTYFSYFISSGFLERPQPSDELISSSQELQR